MSDYIFVFIGHEGRVTTSHWSDYKGESLSECLHDIEKGIPHEEFDGLGELRWEPHFIDGQFCLAAKHPY